MIDKVFFDTNIVRAENGIKNFLGGREELSKFQKVAEIMMPDVVIDEIISQKKKKFKENRDRFKSNPYFFIHELNQEKMGNEYIDQIIQEMKDSEEIQFSIVGLNNENILNDIRQLALTNSAPFNIDDDKGFKDTLIYFIIIQYSENNPSDRVYLISRDIRLEEALKSHPTIVVFKDYNEYQNHQESYFTDNYFIERLQQEFIETYGDILEGKSLDPSCIESVDLDENLIWILKLKIMAKDYLLEVDYASKEILSLIDMDF